MLYWFPHIPMVIQQGLFPIVRWLHIVCTSLLVGGTLFYEFVIPKAIEDLKEETQLAVLGRVRWFFRQVVIFSAITLILTGLMSVYHQWPLYNGEFHAVMFWLYLHLAVGLISLVIAVAAMIRTQAPRHPLILLRINFVILLIVIFIVAVARHLRLMIRENEQQFKVVPTDTRPIDTRPPDTRPTDTRDTR
jgi:uncharacterized membrane protein